jgi:hypothetical protein
LQAEPVGGQVVLQLLDQLFDTGTPVVVPPQLQRTSLAVVVERVFEGFIGQAIRLLEKIRPQHALQPDGRTSACAVGIEGFDDGQQFRPRNEGFHPREELLAAGGFLFGGKLAWEKLD